MIREIPLIALGGFCGLLAGSWRANLAGMDPSGLTEEPGPRPPPGGQGTGQSLWLQLGPRPLDRAGESLNGIVDAAADSALVALWVEDIAIVAGGRGCASAPARPTNRAGVACRVAARKICRCWWLLIDRTTIATGHKLIGHGLSPPGKRCTWRPPGWMQSGARARLSSG